MTGNFEEPRRVGAQAMVKEKLFSGAFRKQLLEYKCCFLCLILPHLSVAHHDFLCVSTSSTLQHHNQTIFDFDENTAYGWSVSIYVLQRQKINRSLTLFYLMTLQSFTLCLFAVIIFYLFIYNL